MTEFSPHRRLAAILYADVVGYSRLMGADEAGTLARLKVLRETIFKPQLATYHGRIIRLMGDGTLVEFPSIVDALACAVEVQRAVAVYNREVAEEQRIVFRIGINLGDIMVDDEDIHGDGVNIAARLEPLAEPGGICISQFALDAVSNKLALDYEDMGAQSVKNIAKPVRSYRVKVSAEAVMPQGGGALPKPPDHRRTTSTHWRWPAVAALSIGVVLITTLAVYFFYPAGSPPLDTIETSVLDKQRIAVLPLINLSADPDNEYFSDGMTEELISKLSRLKELAVIARTSVMSYKGSNKKIDDIGRELQVGTILEGSVRKSANKLRITVQLIDVMSQEHLWSQDYDRDIEDVFAIQSDVAQNVADALQIAIGTSEKHQIEEQVTHDLEAYNLYLQGLYLFHKASEEGLNQSIAHFERALQHDPSFARAYAGTASAYQVLGFLGLRDTRDAFEKSRAAAEKALELDDTIVDAHLVAAANSQILDYDQERAGRAYQRAVELAPNSAFAHDWYGIQYLSPMGRHEEAIAETRRAVELDPVSALHMSNLGWVYYMAHQYDPAIEYLQKGLELEPDVGDTYRALGVIYVQKGMYDEAIAAMKKNVELTGDHTDYGLGYLGYAYAMAGQRDKAMELLNTLQKRATRQTVVPYAFAPLYVGLGEKDKAIESLWQDYEQRASPFLLWLKVFPTYDSLHSEPRFQELLSKIGVAPQ